jgi:hypothetical protein
MKCWGCDGYHLYSKYFHKGERISIVYNIQEDETVVGNIVFINVNDNSFWGAYKFPR